ncbi:AVAST type 1 anti-phage system MBL fold metallo-hydrolase Avs1a [Paenibacillus sp. PK1-4R]|uniref:AVAST type 1 anti-phage system MBL fold metallo-hydrolase Avs1a n=1 Tax=Paenibacillus sp. PK1-4R TaxID=3049075 RepID=UPI0025A19BB3|nr:AVAST type 1 anti-phage system MBL fold metallo-hydrolase Avs1a [Paenibacillus sp. PK1-4R]WJM05902.1 AVAST type 1 anti-phage system MBL fold metallo-hydrolase Avs1a [Paenibacillus sp. PK1-4R]
MRCIDIEMFPASYGDSFLISCRNGEKEKTNLLIDTGFISTYEECIRDRLLFLNESGERLALLVITHIDADHLSGALKLLEENEQTSKIVPIDKVWHNSFRHLQWEKSSSSQVLGMREKKLLEEVKAQGYPSEVKKTENKEKPISAKQGSSLASLILQGGYSWNIDFAGQAVCVENRSEIHLNSDVMITLLSPRLNQLKELEKYWKRKLYKLGYRKEITDDAFFDDAFEFLVSREKAQAVVNQEKEISSSPIDLEELLRTPFTEDTRATNGSSIAFVLQFKEKKILFLGDSHPSIIEQELKSLYGGEMIWFDAVKISHHGSSSNTSPGLLNLIDSANFFVSTNGVKFHHPDLITLARIVCRESKEKRNLIFNYETPASNYMDDEQRKQKYNYEVRIASEGQIIEI